MANNRKPRSMKGEVVDFDLLKIKQKIQSNDKPTDVERREQYIDIRRRRNPRRNVADLVADQERNENDAAEKIRLSREAKKNRPVPSVSAPQNEAPVKAAKPDPAPVVEEAAVETPEETAAKKIVKRSKPKE